jgi:metacaspase-1
MSNRALCIGINNYPGTGSDLSGCVNDANDWAAELKKRGFAVSKLLDKKATGANMRTAIGQLVSGAVSGDVVVVQYSGHGSYVADTDGDEPDGVDEVLCPHDIDSRGPLTDDELYDLFNDRKSGVKVVHDLGLLSFGQRHAVRADRHAADCAWAFRDPSQGEVPASGGIPQPP